MVSDMNDGSDADCWDSVGVALVAPVLVTWAVVKGRPPVAVHVVDGFLLLGVHLRRAWTGRWRLVNAGMAVGDVCWRTSYSRIAPPRSTLLSTALRIRGRRFILPFGLARRCALAW